MTVEELLDIATRKIGVLTLENEMLRLELNRLKGPVEPVEIPQAEEVEEAEASQE